MSNSQHALLCLFGHWHTALCLLSPQQYICLLAVRQHGISLIRGHPLARESLTSLSPYPQRALSAASFHSAILIFFFLTLKMFQPAVHQPLKLRRPVWVFLTFLHVQLYQCVLKEDINFIICQRIPIASIYYAGCVHIGLLISRKAGEKIFP